MLADDFHADGALSGDDVRVVEGRNVGQAASGHQSDGVVVGIVVGCAFQYDFAAAFFNGERWQGLCRLKTHWWIRRLLSSNN